MHAHKHVFLAVNIAVDERHVLLVGQRLAIADRVEFTIWRGQAHLCDALDQLLRATAILDHVGNGDDLDAVLGTKFGQIGNASHRAVGVHDLADHTSGSAAGELCNIHGGFGLPRALEHATWASA